MTRCRQLIGSSFVFLLLAQMCFGASSPAWRSKTIYQLLTDRFARSDGSTSPCADISTYCGGTWQGVENNIDYITGMGFDAIWISPVVDNTPGGYHGYWMRNLNKVNDHFGSSSDLSSMVNTAHNNGVWVMVDVVGNHVGPVNYDYSSIVPFNQPAYYHDCSNCPSGCQIQDFNNQAQVELCRLSGLPDLNQTNPIVASFLYNWISNMVNQYKFDGLRIDTVPEVAKKFWYNFNQKAGVFAIGEVYNGDVNYVASYQGPLDSVLSYPLYFTLVGCFAYKNSFHQLEGLLASYKAAFTDLSVLGTFIDNHDHQRFLNYNNDHAAYRNALTYVITAIGIPIIYYGTEQGFAGGNDPNNREPLWTSGYNTNTDLYTHIKTLVAFRKQAQLWNYDQVQRYADDNFYAYTRDQYFVALTNVGQNGNQIVRTITYHPYKNGQKLCNLFYPTDCVVVANNQFQVYLDNGESKVLLPSK
eukprot:TRINITY_DN1998_c0_g1_i1.p1 TRINITY_DN1998_c0_g1~~TRINITY_DN1998_c0_g1_i1.p1  ORF type:complete len:471 (-),score=85.46 TRINITY_DN1998_c0_g1_i1:52-1464(-)